MEFKTCKKCNIEQSISNYYRHATTKDKLQIYCKKCCSEANKKYITSNKEHYLQNKREWYSNNREKEIKRSIEYYQNNKPKHNANKLKHKAALKDRVPKWLTVEDKIIIRAYYQLASMRSKESEIKWHVDHIVPLRGKNVCGLHVPWNLRVIPAKENMIKSNKHAA